MELIRRLRPFVSPFIPLLMFSACALETGETDDVEEETSGPLSITQDTLMAVHACLATECSQGPSKHSTYLLQSADAGETWSVVTGWTPYTGSVPDIIRRNGKIYIYNPGQLRVVDIQAGTLSEPATVTVSSSAGASVQFVDPSPVLDSSGRIVLHYLESTGIQGDPASCSSYPCTKNFGSAVEVDGSEGTRFVADSGYRASVTISSSSDPLGPVASDPDIFAHASGYVLYISRGNSTQAFEGTSLSGSFTNPTSGAVSLANQGGVPAGHFDGTQYWAMTNRGSTSNPAAKVIRRAKAATLAGLATATFEDWITAATLGLSEDYSVESPGFLSAGE